VGDPAEILRTLSDEYDRSAEAKTHQARMADGNAHREHLPAGDVDAQLRLAAAARQEAEFFQERAAALRAGAEALETSRQPTGARP
jgi:hypothetical protein